MGRDDSGQEGKKQNIQAVARIKRLTPAQQKLASENIGLVGLHLRNRVPTPSNPMRHREYDDLFQEGCVALARAAARYDPQHDGAFGAYAIQRIRGGVHVALYELFSLIQVPARVTKRAEPGLAGLPASVHRPVQALGAEFCEHKPFEAFRGELDDTIRHVFHRRYEAAVRGALQEMHARIWRRRNPCAIMERIANERMLISAEADRTPLREIARAFELSSGRASAYEQDLTQTVIRHFATDPQVPMLLGLAREDADGLDGVVDAERRQKLHEATIDGFTVRFEKLDRRRRADAIYEMLERSSGPVREVARNLFRLTWSEDGPLPISA